MKPSEVPCEWIQTGADAAKRHFSEESGLPFKVARPNGPLANEARIVIAAVYDDIEKQVRAKVAAELHARADEAVPGTGFKRGLRAAAHHANPTTIEDAAKAVQAMYEKHIARGEG